jgi:hypothetical protein
MAATAADHHIYDKMGVHYLNQSREDLDAEIAGFAALREKRTV